MVSKMTTPTCLNHSPGLLTHPTPHSLNHFLWGDRYFLFIKIPKSRMDMTVVFISSHLFLSALVLFLSTLWDIVHTQLKGCRGRVYVCSNASVRCSEWLGCGALFTLWCRGVCSHVLLLLLPSLSYFTASLAALSAVCRERSSTAFVISYNTATASSRLHRGRSLSDGFARLPRQNNRILVGFRAQRRVPTWKMLGWGIFSAIPSGHRENSHLLHDPWRGSRCVYASPRFGKPPSQEEIHVPIFLSLSSCPQHRLRRPVKAAPPLSPKRARTAPERRWENMLCNV